MQTINRLESEVRSYCRSFPTVFTRARGSYLESATGRRYLDFFSGAGALNYGHNDPVMRRRLIEYLTEEGVTHSLDMATRAKARFLERFEEVILQPRDLTYRVQFPGPTGTNAVEAALKLARKVTGRTNVVAFTDAFHGMTLGSLAATANPGKRQSAGVPLPHCIRMPFCGARPDGGDSLSELESLLERTTGSDQLPAAVIVETVQGEGGVNVASFSWLKGLATLCRRFSVLLVVDDIQVGCGRTGPFFSFEPAGITPDLICLSKSLSGYGTPMAVVLIRPDLDQWEPGEHNGTFRGHNLAFVTATAALSYWVTDDLTQKVLDSARLVRRGLEEIAADHAEDVTAVRGRGLMQGIAFRDIRVAAQASKEAFARGLIIETAGPEDEVVKLLPPLTTEPADLERGLAILADSVTSAREALGGKTLAHTAG